MTAESRFLPVDGELFWKDQGGEIDAMTAVTQLRDHHYTTFSLVHSYSRFEGEPYSIDRWQTAMLTPEELALGFDAFPHQGQDDSDDFPDEEKVLEIAAAWGIDTFFEKEEYPPAVGMVCAGSYSFAE